MVLVYISFYVNFLEIFRFLQCEFFVCIFGCQEVSEYVCGMDFEENFSDFGFDYEMEEFNEGKVFLFIFF